MSEERHLRKYLFANKSMPRVGRKEMLKKRLLCLKIASVQNVDVDVDEDEDEDEMLGCDRGF